MSDLQKRNDDLLEANTRYLLRARKSEELIKKLFNALPKNTLLAREVKLHLEEPWK